MSEQDQIHQALQTITDRMATAPQDCLQRVADAVAATDNTQLLKDLLSSPEPIHFGTLIFPSINQLSQLADSIDATNQYAAGHADETLCQMLQQIKSQMDALYPRLVEPGEETTVYTMRP